MHVYFIAILKAQVIEFTIFNLYIVHRYSRMIRKNLLYTAITRCKKSLIHCGEKDAFFKGIRTLDTNKHYTTLKQLLQAKMNDETIESENKVADGELPNPEPETEETDFSPFDFM